jgi:recombination protein RecR
MEGDTTFFIFYKQIADSAIVISTIARGIAVGDELEYADEVTLGSILLGAFRKIIQNVN